MLGFTNGSPANSTSKRFRSSFFVFGLTSIFILSVGCYPDYPVHTGGAEVQGVVKLDGRPVNQAKVVFLPTRFRNRNNTLPICFGITNGDGQFTLTTASGEKEIPAAKYRILICRKKLEKDAEGSRLYPWTTGLMPQSAAGVANIEHSDETIPSIYNLESRLDYLIQPSPKIVRPVFDLSSVDKLLVEN
ncbi:MAG: hypothetical protein AAF939_03070 [Planctomycetota bacterium]